MIDYEWWMQLDPFSLSQKEKEKYYIDAMNALYHYHKEHCLEYEKLCHFLGDNPLVPVRLFKEFDLCSVEADKIFKVMTSSGTTGQQVSRINLDRDTSARQTKVLAKIVRDFTGSDTAKGRLPMLILDSNSVLKNRQMFSARGAGILGFSILGRDITYALDENMELDIDAVNNFAQKYEGQPVLIFGFTYMIWQYFYKPLKERGITLPLRGTVIHGGGWKKLSDQAVSHDEFIEAVKSVTSVEKVLNYYGMVEQTGSIYMECEYGHLHASIYSDIDIVDGDYFEPLSIGKRGLVETKSILPTSYPGHRLLTEDEGTLLGIDDCPCGRKGKYFIIHGRLKGAEIRGCSDTHERH